MLTADTLYVVDGFNPVTTYVRVPEPGMDMWTAA